LLGEFLNRPFHLLDKKSNRWLLIIVTGIFVILFMNLYLPFNITRWYEKEKIPLFLILSSFGIIGMIVLAISQLYFRDLFKISSMKMYGVILWFIVELLLLTVTMYFIYGDTTLEGNQMLSEIILTFKYTILILIIPYTGVLLYLFATEKGDYSPIPIDTGDHLVKILDENDALHIAIDLEQILYMKSADNYVAVYYLKDSKVKKELVRTTMKKLETELRDFPIRRCHRSFMVNIKKISVSEKSQQGLSLSLKDYPDEVIPVSKNYKTFFTQLFKEKRLTPA
jgi:hypothetical protein